jgi:hypothetical protein
MTGQILLTIIIILFFIIPLILHYHKITELFNDVFWHEILNTTLFIISLIYLLIMLSMFIYHHWNTPIF